MHASWSGPAGVLAGFDSRQRGIVALRPIAAASAKGRAYRGRKPSFDRKQLKVVNNMLTAGAGASSISKATGLTQQAVLRIRANPVDAERALKVWSM